MQHALKLKARREARLRAAQSSPLSFNSTARSDGGYSTVTSPMFSYAPTTTAAPSSTAYTTPPMSLMSNAAYGAAPSDADVDFSPSVRPEPVHPVPISFNDGATLDWGSMLSDDEKPDHRKWPLHLRKKQKDKIRGNEPVVEQQDSVYTGLLLTITHTRPRTNVIFQTNSRALKQKRNLTP